MAYAALVVDLTAKLAGYQQSMNQAVKVANDSAKKIEKAFSFGSGVKAGAGFFAAQLGLESIRDTLNKAKELTDEWTRVRVLVENVTKSLGEAERAQRGLYEAAQATRQNYGELTRSFASFARNADQLNITSDQAVKLQTTIAQAIALSGARADSAASALVQFGQGIASGTLRGEELNSVLEQTPKLAKAIADGMGIPIGELIRMGKEGELTADRIITALQKIAPKIQEEFAKVTPTIADSFTALNNALGNLVNRFNEILPIGTALSNILLGAAAAIDKIVEFSRFDPMVAARNAKAYNDQTIDRAKDALDVLTNPDNPQYDAKIPANLRANAVEIANMRLKRALEASAVLAKRMEEQGFLPDGSPRPNLAKIEESTAAREDQKRLDAAKKWGAEYLKIRGISNDFFNQQKALFDQFWYEFGPPQTWSDDIRKKYNDLYKEILDKSGFNPKKKKEKEDTDPIGDLLLRLGDKERDQLEKWRDDVLKLVDPLRELRQELEIIDELARRGPADGGITQEQAAVARGEVEQQMLEAQKKFERKQLLRAEPLTEVREQLEEYLAQLRLEADLMTYTEVERETRVKLLDAEKKGLERNSAEWEKYRGEIENALKQKRLAELDSARGASFDSRTEDIALLTERLQQQLEEANLFAADPAPFVQSYLDAVGAILQANKEAKDDLVQLGQAFTSFFEKSILEGGSWADAWKGLLKDIAQQVLRAQITGPMAKSVNKAMEGAFGGNTLWSAFTGLFGRAEGGLVGAGQTYLVGERGVPEVFTAPANGRITPLNKLGGGPVVNNYITVSGEVSRADVYNAVALAEQRTKAAILDSYRRNGAFARV